MSTQNADYGADYTPSGPAPNAPKPITPPGKRWPRIEDNYRLVKGIGWVPRTHNDGSGATT